MTTLIRRIGSRLGMGVWLLAIWLLLWGRADAATVAGGAVVAVIAYALSRLPAAPVVTRIRPLRLAAAALEFMWELLASSVVIGRHVLHRPAGTRGAIIEVGARSRSELVILAVTTSISLRPGTLLVGVDWERSILRIHCMPAGSAEEADGARDGVLRTEGRLMQALVSVSERPSGEERR